MPSALRRCAPLGCQAYISGKALVPMLQLLHIAQPYPNVMLATMLYISQKSTFNNIVLFVKL